MSECSGFWFKKMYRHFEESTPSNHAHHRENHFEKNQKLHSATYFEVLNIVFDFFFISSFLAEFKMLLSDIKGPFLRKLMARKKRSVE